MGQKNNPRHGSYMEHGVIKAYYAVIKAFYAVIKALYAVIKAFYPTTPSIHFITRALKQYRVI